LTSDQVDQEYNTVVSQDRNNKIDDNNSYTITIHGVKYGRTINVVNITYQINYQSSKLSGYLLVACGANSGFFGSDIKIINQTIHMVTITGIDNHQVGNLPICTGADLGICIKDQ
jgi:hypothetical protein